MGAHGAGVLEVAGGRRKRRLRFRNGPLIDQTAMVSMGVFRGACRWSPGYEVPKCFPRTFLFRSAGRFGAAFQRLFWRCVSIPAATGGCAGMTDWIPGFDSGQSLERRLRNGTPAQAEILRIWSTPLEVNEQPVIGMEVEVRPIDRQPFRATINRTIIGILSIPQFQPGKIIAVRFNPKDPGQVALDRTGAAFDAPSTETRCWLGVSMQDLTPDLSRRCGYTGGNGVFIDYAVPMGPAAGIVHGADIMVEVDGAKVTDIHQFSSVLAPMEPGHPAKVKVFRGGTFQTVVVKAAERPAEYGGK